MWRQIQGGQGELHFMKNKTFVKYLNLYLKSYYYSKASLSFVNLAVVVQIETLPDSQFAKT